jgi:tyrosinase
MENKLEYNKIKFTYEQGYRNNEAFLRIPLPSRTLNAQTPRKRMNIKELENDSEASETFMTAMKLSIESGEYSKLVTHHSQFMFDIHSFGGSPHTNERFLPWHRVYLLKFENLLNETMRKANPGKEYNIAIPYWNWEQYREIPSLLRDFMPTMDVEVYLYDDNNQPTGSQVVNLQVERSLDPDFGNQLPKDNIIKQIMAKDTFVEFSDRLEKIPHNRVHVLVGGTMSNPLVSPLDPLFWLHHANIDKIWASWTQLKINEGKLEYIYPNLSGREAEMHPWFPEFMEIQTRNIVELGYTYTHL